jgi:uncharacterized membrane protein YoaK (UPF0700 family)
VTVRVRASRLAVALALVLAAVAGFVDVCAYMSFGAYAANMTGNAIAFAIGATGRAGGAVWERAATMAFFVAGGLAGAGLIGDTEATSLRGRRLGALLTVEAALLVAAVLLGPRDRALGVVPIGLGVLAVAAGLQNVSFRRVGGVTVRTTHITGSLTRTTEAVAVLARWLMRHGRGRSARRRWTLLRLVPRQPAARTAALVSGLFAVFVAGGCAGAIALPAWGRSALLAPTLVLLAAALVAHTAG